MASTPDPDDTQLINRCRSGDEAAWTVLVRRYERLIYTVPRRAGLADELAADVFQTVFAALHRHLHRIDCSRRWASADGRCIFPPRPRSVSQCSLFLFPSIRAMKHGLSAADDDVGRALRRAMSDPVPPNQVSDAAIALWQKVIPEASPLGQLVQVFANMVFDSTMHSPAALGMRSAGTHAPIRHLLFSAEGRDIDLRISADPAAKADRWRIGGQVLGPDAAGQVTAERAGAEPLSTALDAMGEFSVIGLTAGRYIVTLRCGTTEIVLPPIDVGGDA